jgi:hypothetical protein
MVNAGRLADIFATAPGRTVILHVIDGSSAVISPPEFIVQVKDGRDASMLRDSPSSASVGTR